MIDSDGAESILSSTSSNELGSPLFDLASSTSGDYDGFCDDLDDIQIFIDDDINELIQLHDNDVKVELITH